jgi:hypothetical protein
LVIPTPNSMFALLAVVILAVDAILIGRTGRIAILQGS